MKKRIISNHMIKNKTSLLAERMNSSPNKPDVILCVLSGGFLFFSDLVKQLAFDFEVEFIKNKILVNDISLVGKKVLVIEDIFDSGKTVKELDIVLDYEFVQEKHYVALLARNTFRQEENIDFLFSVAKENFVYGYGLDDRFGKNRHLEDIYIEE